MMRSMLLRLAMLLALFMPVSALALIEADDGGADSDYVVTLSQSNWNAFQNDARAKLKLPGNAIVDTIYLPDAAGTPPPPEVHVIIDDRDFWARAGSWASNWIRIWGIGETNGIEVKIKTTNTGNRG